MLHKEKPYKIGLYLLLAVVAVCAVLITGCKAADEMQHEEESHEDSLKVKVTEQDREPDSQELAIIDKLYISDLSSYGTQYGSAIYSTVTVTGEAMPEESVYSVKDFEELIKISFTNQKMNDMGLFEEVDGYYGLDFIKFMELCGIDKDINNLTIVCQDAENNRKSLPYKKLSDKSKKVVLAVGNADGPFSMNENGIEESIMLMIFQDDEMKQQLPVRRIIAGSGKAAEDPEYGFHDYDPYKDSLESTFTVEIYQEGAEYLGATDVVEFTTEEMENLMRENPSKVYGSYYGTIGSEETYSYAGAGGWVDYFEGIDFLWLLKEKVGIQSLDGRAELVGRDGEVYNTIDDLKYFDYIGKEESYYIMTKDGVKIPGAIPVIACKKNGYPILKEHEHESEAYVAYNTLNRNLEKKGVVTEVGVIKNHNGPFVACFGNLDGFYGGEQMETGGDCTLIKIYLE